MIIPIKIGATGIVTKVLKKSLEAVTGKPSTHLYKRQLQDYFECHTQYRKYSNLQIKI
jgi:hypothetical protein